MGSRRPQCSVTRQRSRSMKINQRDVLAVLCAALVDDDAAPDARNLYSNTAQEYEDDARNIACSFADQLGLAAARAAAYVGALETSRQLRQAMESRAVIEQAK